MLYVSHSGQYHRLKSRSTTCITRNIVSPKHRKEIKEHLVVLYRIKNSSKWKYSLDNEFCVEVFESREAAVDAAFEALDKVIYRN